MLAKGEELAGWPAETQLLTFEGEETANSFPSWLLQNCISVPSHKLHPAVKTSIGSLFEEDPNYLVQTEPHSAFVTRSLGFTVCGEKGTGVNFPPPAAPSVLENFSAALQKTKEVKTSLLILYFAAVYRFISLLYT